MSALRVLLRNGPGGKLREAAGSTKIVISWLICQTLVQGQLVSFQPAALQPVQPNNNFK